MRRGFALIPICLCAVFAVTAHAATPAACGKLLPPAQGAYFGAGPGYANEDAYYEGPADGFDQDAGLKAAWTAVGEWWSATLPFPTKTVESIWQDGKVPLLRLSPYPHQVLDVDFNGMSPGPFSLEDIAAGKFDAQLRGWADTARDLDIPVLVDFGSEMNNYFPWSLRNNGAGRTDGYGDPAYPDGAERFRDAYRHIVTVTRDEGATNITWMFHPDTLYYYGQPSWNSVRWSYPGDDYVDWIGASLYAFPKVDGSGYTTLGEKLDTYHEPGVSGLYTELTSISSKPFALLETGFFNVPVAARVPWVADAAATFKSGVFPRLKGMTWYVTSDTAFNSVINASPEFQAAFRTAFDDPFFAAKPQFSGNCAPSSAPKRVTWKAGRLTWSIVPNAQQYEIWRGPKKIATTTYTTFGASKRATYRVRAVNLAGVSSFTKSR